jgi:hypothetical protein
MRQGETDKEQGNKGDWTSSKRLIYLQLINTVLDLLDLLDLLETVLDLLKFKF